MHNSKLWDIVAEYYHIIESAKGEVVTEDDNNTSLAIPNYQRMSLRHIILKGLLQLLNLLKGDKFTGKVVTIQETQTSHQALESLYDLDYMDMAQLISDKYKIEFEKSRLKNENRDISDEDIYLPDGLEVLLHNIKQCKINGKKERISFNDLSGNCIVINRKYYDTYTVSIGNEEINLNYAYNRLKFSVLYYIKMIDDIYESNFLYDCIKELIEHKRIAVDNPVFLVPEDFSVIYRDAYSKYKGIDRKCNSLVFENATRFETERKQYYENLRAKKEMKKKVEEYREPSSLVQSNQGLPNQNVPEKRDEENREDY